jgi:hypothetical protein
MGVFRGWRVLLVSQWKAAQTLDNYTTSYGHVMVFDSAFNLRGAYAF